MMSFFFFIGCEAQEKSRQGKFVFNRLIIKKKSEKLGRTTEILHDVISLSKSAFKAAWVKLCTDFCTIVDHSLFDKMCQNAFGVEFRYAPVFCNLKANYLTSWVDS